MSRTFSSTAIIRKEDMASYTPKECGICNIEYNELNRCPRSLPCSHCICSECIQNLINRNKKSCPFCRQNFVARSPRDIGVNTGLLDVLKLLKEMEQNKVASGKPSETLNSKANDLTGMKTEIEDAINETLIKYKEVENQSNAAIYNNVALRDGALKDIQAKQRTLLARVEGMMATTAQRVRYINEQNDRLESEWKSMQVLQVPLEEAKAKLKTADSLENAGALIDEATNITAEAQKCLKSFKISLSENKRMHQTNEVVANGMKEKMRIIHDFISSPVEEEEELEFKQDLQLKKIQGRGPELISVEILQEMTEHVVNLVKQGKVFAVQQLEGLLRYAQMSISRENRICLHHLSEGSLPPNSHIILHSDIMRLVNSSSRLTFLELSNAKKQKLGRVYIRLNTDGNRALQFTLLCTAKSGLTYTNSKILELWGKDRDDESLRFGNYENNGGSGGKALLPKVWKEEGPENRQPQIAGIVQGRNSWFGEAQAAQFWIYTRSVPEKECHSCFGMVEEGLEVLTEAIRTQSNIKDVFISDSGVVLPL